MHKNKVSTEEKLEAAQACAEGRISKSEAARRLGVAYVRLDMWVAQYKESGRSAFERQGKNKVYSAELKRQVVMEYLRGGKSQKIITAKYGLRSTKTLYQWIKVYNSGKEFGHMSGGCRMKQGRKTTQEERIQRNLGILTPLEKNAQYYLAA